MSRFGKVEKTYFVEISRSRSSMYESSVSYVIRCLGGAAATLSTSCETNDAKVGSFTSIFFMNSFFNSGNMARDLTGSPFCFKTDWIAPSSSRVPVSFFAVSVGLF